MGGVSVTAWYLFESSARAHTISVVQEEGGYLLGKVLWALYGAREVTTPGAGATGPVLTIVKWDTSVGDPLLITNTGTDLTLKRGTATAEVLNNVDVWITNLTFTHVKGSGDGINPDSVRTSFMLSMRTPNGMIVSRNFSGVSYLRQ